MRLKHHQYMTTNLVSNNELVPPQYLGWAIIYTFLYGAIAMLLSLVLFEDRDLAPNGIHKRKKRVGRKPGFVVGGYTKDDHLSRPTVADGLKQLTRKS